MDVAHEEPKKAGRVTAPERAPERAPEHAPASDRNLASTALDLQRRAGNAAVAAFVGQLSVQRHPAPTTNAQAEQAAGGQPGTATASGATETTATTEAATTEETSQPGTGTTGTTGTATLTGAARSRAIQDALRASNTGQWALGVITRWSIPVDYEFTGQGSYHQGGRIYINRSLGIGAAAMTMMHEAQHADTFKSGRQANPANLTRDEFVRRSIADEAEAVVRQIEGLAVTQSLNIDMAGNSVGPALKQRYLRVFYAKRDELRAANPEMSTAEINARCRTFARDTEVTTWFSDGTFITSTNNNNYYVFYGLQWDAAHATGS